MPGFRFQARGSVLLLLEGRRYSACLVGCCFGRTPLVTCWEVEECRDQQNGSVWRNAYRSIILIPVAVLVGLRGAASSWSSLGPVVWCGIEDGVASAACSVKAV